MQKNITLGDNIALLRVEGPIFDSKDTIDELKGYVKDSSIKAIVLRVDSPGGAVAPSQEIYEEVRKAVVKKKIVVSMGSVAASGGYYIAAPASRIIANPGTLTGSIGVIMEIPNIEEQYVMFLQHHSFSYVSLDIGNLHDHPDRSRQSAWICNDS